MKRICLDTSAYSNFMRGSSAAVAAICNTEWVGIPSVALGELRTGFLLGAHAERNEEELSRFLMHPLVHVLDVDDAASAIYAEIIVALRHSGTPLPTNDIWIASVAAREGASVVTYDEHFRKIHRVGSHILKNAAD
jgi:tRNA(fMet)-specific endonuclease VapC